MSQFRKEWNKLEASWLSRCLNDPTGKIMECALCGKEYKHRGDFLTATLCDECKESELQRVERNYTKLLEWYKLKPPRPPIPEMEPYPTKVYGD